MCFVFNFRAIGNYSGLYTSDSADYMLLAPPSTTNVPNTPYSAQRSMNVHENKMRNCQSEGHACGPRFANAMYVGHPSPQYSTPGGSSQQSVVKTVVADDVTGRIRMTDSAPTEQPSDEVRTPSSAAPGNSSPPSISIVNVNNSCVVMNTDSGISTNTYDSYNDNSTTLQDRIRSAGPTDAKVDDPHRHSSRRGLSD